MKRRSNQERTAVYAGTFDPITNGHLDIIKRASKIFERLIVAVASDTEKTSMFEVEERVSFIKAAIKSEKIKNAEVRGFGGLLVNFVSECGSGVIIRGLRAVSDFEYEFQMSCVNSKLDSKIETIFLPSSESLHFVSSRFVKSIAKIRGDVSGFVPKNVNKAIKAKISKAEAST